MAKTSKSPSKNNKRDRRSREPSEFAETTLSLDRVTRVVKGGRRMRFRAVVVVGNRKGKVGLGTGKANEVQAAVSKAVKDAKRNMVKITIKKGTIPHEVDVKFKAARLRLMPASEGTGIIAGGALRVVLDHAGVSNVLAKRFGTGNKLVNAQAAMRALERFVHKGPDVAEEVSTEEAEKMAESQMEVVEVSREDINREGGLVKKEKKSE